MSASAERLYDDLVSADLIPNRGWAFLSTWEKQRWESVVLGAVESFDCPACGWPDGDEADDCEAVDKETP